MDPRDKFTEDEIRQLKTGKAVRIGGKLYRICGRCRHVIRLDKPFVGDLHLCE